MRPATRHLAAAVQRASAYLTPNAPTGLTGLLTHRNPRPALLYHYTSTLQKLERLPETSAYRKATEALTRRRLAIVSGVEPEGFDEWQRRIEDHFVPLMEKHPVMAKELVVRMEVKGKPYLYQMYRRPHSDDREEEWDGEPDLGVELGEGLRSEELRDAQDRLAESAANAVSWEEGAEIENEPPLTADQVSEIEQKIGAGLIEEIIDVAKREQDLVDTMFEHKVWEELEEKPSPGQWSYFERTTGTS